MVTTGMKTCSCCHASKPATSEHFPERKGRWVGLRAQCRACYLNANRRGIARNPEKHATSARLCYERKKAEYLAVNKAWRDASGYERTPRRLISSHVRSYIWRALRQKSRGAAPKPGALRWLPYGAEELAAHIERQFAPGMGWHNTSEWHVDHIRPVSSFRFTSQIDPDFQACWALSNLQPLWAVDNMRKHARMPA